MIKLSKLAASADQARERSDLDREYAALSSVLAYVNARRTEIHAAMHARYCACGAKGNEGCRQAQS